MIFELSEYNWNLSSSGCKSNFALAKVWVGGHPPTNFSNKPKKSASFYTNVVLESDGANMVLNEKPAEKNSNK